MNSLRKTLFLFLEEDEEASDGSEGEYCKIDVVQWDGKPNAKKKEKIKLIYIYVKFK